MTAYKCQGHLECGLLRVPVTLDTTFMLVKCLLYHWLRTILSLEMLSLVTSLICFK